MCRFLKIIFFDKLRVNTELNQRIKSFKIDFKLKIVNFKLQEWGFTLVELLVAVAIISTLSTFGIASFVAYSQTQSLNTTVTDIANMLETARGKALTQIKPIVGNCNNNPLDGYRVTIDKDNKKYSLDPICGGSVNTETTITSQLPAEINFGANATFTFRVLGGEVDNAASSGTGITISNSFGQTKTITVYSDGRVKHD